MNKIVRSLYRVIFWILNNHKFKKFSFSSVILRPLRIDGKENIVIKNNVLVQYHTWLAAVPINKTNKASLVLEEGVTIGNFNHIYATGKIEIKRNVLTADKVYISDNLHSYENPDIDIIKQPIKQIKDVVIGEGSWLGENVCVIGSKIGKHCVIGANSVVTKDIPEYSVAVGIPAKVIKKYNKITKQWEKIY